MRGAFGDDMMRRRSRGGAEEKQRRSREVPLVTIRS
jgi:hypothetical protein